MPVYKTKQKELILSAVKRFYPEHFTAEDILTFLNEQGTPVGKATLYRSLDKLVEDGEVKKFATDGFGSCFQYVGAECLDHYHLKCSVCGQLIHLDCDFIDELVAHVLKDHGFLIDPSRMLFCGTCVKCRDNKGK